MTCSNEQPQILMGTTQSPLQMLASLQDGIAVLYKLTPHSGPFSHHGKGKERAGESSPRHEVFLSTR